MARRRFTREFKREAVRLIKDRGVSYAQASEDLGVHPTQLRHWVKALADDPQHAFPGVGQMKPEQLEITRLKSEVIKLKVERDILKRMACPVRKRFVLMAMLVCVNVSVCGWPPVLQEESDVEQWWSPAVVCPA